MPLAVTINSSTFDGSKVRYFGTIVPSGSYPTGGDTLNFNTATWPIGQSGPSSSGLPDEVLIFSARGAASPQTNRFDYSFAPGTTQANGKMQVFTGAAAQTALTELNAGAYPAGVTADSIKFEATFPGF